MHIQRERSLAGQGQLRPQLLGPHAGMEGGRGGIAGVAGHRPVVFEQQGERIDPVAPARHPRQRSRGAPGRSSGPPRPIRLSMPRRSETGRRREWTGGGWCGGAGGKGTAGDGHGTEREWEVNERVRARGPQTPRRWGGGEPWRHMRSEDAGARSEAPGAGPREQGPGRNSTHAETRKRMAESGDPKTVTRKRKPGGGGLQTEKRGGVRPAADRSPGPPARPGAAG